MKNEMNYIKDKNQNESKYIQNQTSSLVNNQEISNEKMIEKESTMTSIKNMFNLNKEKKNTVNKNTFSKSFYKSSQQSKKEEFLNNNFVSLIPLPRTSSNCHLNNEQQQHLNNKNFPSKANVCKGNPNSSTNYILPNSSPIFQYYASNQGGQDLGSSLENGNSLGYLGGRDSPQSSGFNFSPSQIFNTKNSHGNVGSGFIKKKSDINIGGPFSIDSEVDEDKIKNLDFRLPLDELCTIEFDDGNFDLNFSQDKNAIVNRINEMKNKKTNEKIIQNGNINLNGNDLDNNININEEINNNLNTNNGVIIEIKKKDINQENNDANKISSNLPIKKAMEKLRKKKSKEIDELANNKQNEHPVNDNNIVNNTNINKINLKSSDNVGVISTKSNEGDHCDVSQNVSADFKKKFEDDLDEMDNDHSFEDKNKKLCDDNNEKNEIKENGEDNNMNHAKNNKEIEPKKNIIMNVNTNKKTELMHDNNNENFNIINKNENQFNDIFNNNNKKVYNINNNNIINNNFNNQNYINNTFNNSFYNNINNIPNNNINNNNFNNNILNYNLLNNYNNINTYSPFDYFLANNNNNNNNNNYKEQQKYNDKRNNIMNQNLPFINNNNIIGNNYNYQIPKNINQYNIDNFNDNTGIPNYNQFLQSTGNINIQNNYFMYNNQDNNNNNNNNNMNQRQNLNQNKNSINNINENKQNEDNNNEKPKKKRKKKQKRLDASTYMNKPLSYIADNFTMMAKDQGASRYLQQLLDNNPKEIVNTLFIPLCKNALKLINDPFGNYLIQKIITYFNQDQLFKFLNIISPSFYEISCNPHGTRVLQKMIGLLSSPNIKNFFYELVKPVVTPLLKDLNGTYIVQKFVKENISDFGLRINAIIIENSTELCTHRHGCCVIQKYLETKDQTMIPGLLDKLIEDSLLLIVDQFGNYVIQTILLMGDRKYGNLLAEKISSNVVFYAKHKYSSNVVEKCFDYCDGVYLKTLMNNVQKKENLVKLILDEHGNYVVQKVLSLSSSKKQKNMLIIIKSLFDKLKNLPYGDRVINRIVMTYPYINGL